MAIWGLCTVPQEAGTRPQLPHCPTSSPSASHLAAKLLLDMAPLTKAGGGEDD